MRLERIVNRWATGVLTLLVTSAVAVATSQAQSATAPQLLPYTARLVAGSGTAAIAKGATCPVSGYTSLDAYGDGCLATEIQLTTTTTTGSGPRYAVADAIGAVFFSDGTNGLIRRVDPVTGIVTLVAGGASSSPAAAKACGSNVSLDALGDGCTADQVKLSHPTALAFDPAGNLYFSDVGQDSVRKIAATNGLITTTGIISLAVGNVSTTYGYNVSNAPGQLTPVIASGNGYLNYPYGIAFDKSGNLYIADEGSQALEVVNLGAVPTTIQGITAAPGAIYKIVGYGSGTSTQNGKSTNVDCPNFVVVSNTTYHGGCNFGSWTDGSKGVASAVDNPYAVAVGPDGTVYFANEFNTNIGALSSTNILTNYAGIQGTGSKTLKRGVAGTFGIGSPWGVASDAAGDLYVTDASSGVIWRVDAGTKNMYPIAGGAPTVCSTVVDANGDSCPALQATYGNSVNSKAPTYSDTALPAPGIFGITVDPYGNVYVGDTETALIREVATGAQFGAIGATQPTDTLEVHFAPGDGPAASNPYTLTSGATNFLLGQASCTTNSDNTMDCLLPVTATPTVTGPFSGTLTVKSSLGASAAFPLTGTYVQSPVTRLGVSYAATVATCSGSATYATTTSFAITAKLVANGPAAPTGTITFFANGTQIGTPQNVTNLGTSANPVYGAVLNNTLSTPNSYTITASYSGDSYFHSSTGKSSNTLTTSTPGFTASPITYQQNTVSAGQTALYSFNVVQNVYTGTISFSCSGLPAGAACVFSPSTLTATGCSTTSTVALSITTTGPVINAGIGGGGSPLWQEISIGMGVLLALALGLRRRTAASLRVVCMAAAMLLVALGSAGCGKGTSAPAPTPSGASTVTVTVAGSTGSSTTLTVPLTVK